MPRLNRKETRWRHHSRSSSYRPKPLRRSQSLTDGVAIAARALFADLEIHLHPADFDQIAVIQAHGAGDGVAVYPGRFLARAEVISVVALINLSRHGRLEPAFQAHRGHGRTSDRSEEHTSELQSRLHLVCRLLLEKKKQQHESTQ